MKRTVERGKRKRVAKRTSPLTQKERLRIADLALKGHSVMEISRIMGLYKNSVSKYIRAMGLDKVVTQRLRFTPTRKGGDAFRKLWKVQKKETKRKYTKNELGELVERESEEETERRAREIRTRLTKEMLKINEELRAMREKKRKKPH